MQSFGIRNLRENIGSYTAEAEAGTISVITRNGTPLTVNIPFDDTLLKLGAHKALAVKLYQDDVLTLSKAAQLAKTPIDQFVAILGSAGVSVIGYDVQELEQELNQF
ncbi:MAG: prevent-host-death family protein [Aestuariibacter sp.]|nr:prevent-host-death family protein [Aestuariibacter sp.]